MARPSPEDRPRQAHGTLTRSVFAIFAGYVTLAVVMMALYALWPRAPRELSARGFHFLGTVIGFWSAVAAGYVTATLVPARETVHAMVLVIVTVLLEAMQYAFVDTGTPFLWWGVAVTGVAVGVMLGSTARRLLPRGFLLRRWRQRR